MLAFKVHVPQLAMVSFIVKDSADNLLAQYTLPMRCMMQGKSFPVRIGNIIRFPVALGCVVHCMYS